MAVGLRPTVPLVLALTERPDRALAHPRAAAEQDTIGWRAESCRLFGSAGELRPATDTGSPGEVVELCLQYGRKGVEVQVTLRVGDDHYPEDSCVRHDREADG